VQCVTTNRLHVAAAAPFTRFVIMLYPTLRRLCRNAQGGKLPLHYAAAKGTSLEVVKLLLDANPETAASADKARHRVRAPQRPSHPLPCRRAASVPR